MNRDDAMPAPGEIIEALPYGVVALEADGTILSANASALDLVSDGEMPVARRCRDLFACRGPSGPCGGDDCLVARAVSSGDPAPEVRIDTVGGKLPGALWVTAAPLPDGQGAILHLRPGTRGDRRRRSGEHWRAGPELRICAFGRTDVEALEDSLEENWLGQRPGRVLKYLVCERARVVMVDEIAESIWPDDGPSAVGKTRYAIHRLRMKLEPRRAAHDSPAFVVGRRGGYTLDRERVWIDADDFEREVVEGRVAMTRLDPVSATEHFKRAMELYRGPFLADEPYAHWAGDERTRLAGMAVYALRLLTALARERDDGADAIKHLQRLAELEPLDNGAHRELVQGLLVIGQRSEAKRRYDNFAHRLRRDLGENPDFDVRSLIAQLPKPKSKRD